MNPKRISLKPILISGLIIGTLDILAAIVQTYIMDGDSLVMLQYIASGAFGNKAFSGGLSFSLMGLLFHYGIAFFWTLLFFLVYPKIPLKNKLVIGLVYGIVVWAAMNLVVLPIVFDSYSLKWPSLLIGMGILVVVVGIPLAYLANWFYGQKAQAPTS
jgi:hypothetical protein